MRGLARAALDGRIPALKEHTFAQLDIPQILTAVVLGKIGTSAVTDTLVQVSRLPKTVLIVDDLHLLVGAAGRDAAGERHDGLLPAAAGVGLAARHLHDHPEGVRDQAGVGPALLAARVAALPRGAGAATCCGRS